MGSLFTTFDVEAFAQREIQYFQGKRLTTTNLATILSRAPKKYRGQVGRRLSELHKRYI